MKDLFPSIPAMFQARTAERGAVAVVLTKEPDGSFRARTGRDLGDAVRRLALGLAALGVGKGDRVAIVSATRFEWANADLAILHLGGVTVGVYPTLLAKDVAWQLAHAEARLAIVEDPAQLEKVRAERKELPGLGHIVVIDPKSERLRDDEHSLDDLLARGEVLERDPTALAALERSWRGVAPQDLATIIYTSGTTGPPKGAMLTHGNICHTVAATLSLFPVSEDELGLVFLPLAHALQRFALYSGICRGARGAYGRKLEEVMDDMRAVRPTVQASVPRIWEKAYAKIRETVASSNPRRKRVFAWALDVGRRTMPYRSSGRPLPLGLRAAHALAKLLVYDRIKTRLFGGRVRFLTSGGAPIDLDVLEYFYALDLLVLEGYGLTETAAPATINRVERFKLGTVGQAIPGTDVRIADDGEVLVRGPGVFKGYWKNDAATKDAFEGEWFKTGDIGELDAEGFLKITDRKKDLIVTSLGKKIPPQNVEGAVKARAALVGSVLVHGDRRKFITALVSLDPEEARAWARARGRHAQDDATLLAALAQDPALRQDLQASIDAANATLAPHERIKKFDVVPEAWSIQDGSLTPTLKLKRRLLEQRHQARLEAFYAESAAPAEGAR